MPCRLRIHVQALQPSTPLHEAVLDAGGSSTLHVVRGAGHAAPAFASEPVVEPVVGFLRDALAIPART